MAHRIAHLLAVSWRDRDVLVAAPAMLIAASIAIRCMPFRNVMATARWRGSETVADDATAMRIVAKARWAVERWATLMPWRTLCFEKGLALHWMLRRRGIASRLHYGLDGRGSDPLSGHVWVSVGGTIVIGGADARRHTCLITLPEAPVAG